MNDSDKQQYLEVRYEDLMKIEAAEELLNTRSSFRNFDPFRETILIKRNSQLAFTLALLGCPLRSIED